MNEASVMKVLRTVDDHLSTLKDRWHSFWHGQLPEEQVCPNCVSNSDRLIDVLADLDKALQQRDRANYLLMDALRVNTLLRRDVHRVERDLVDIIELRQPTVHPSQMFGDMP